MHFIIMTCRPKSQDFRWHLAKSLHEDGHRVEYIWLKRRPILLLLTDNHEKKLNVFETIEYFYNLRSNYIRPIIFNSTNLAFPFFSIFLKLLSKAVMIQDNHDDLMYNYRGWKKFRLNFGQRCLQKMSEISVHASPALIEIYPDSRHFGNATFVKPVIDYPAYNPQKILIMASFDARLDFILLNKVLEKNPETMFDLYGKISKDVEKNIDKIVGYHKNCKYFGPYNDSDIPELLKNYSISYAPYKSDDRLTRFIDPLRYYHCLASGVGVVSTSIPAALANPSVIKCDDADGVQSAFDAAAAARASHPVRQWSDAARQLVALIEQAELQ